MTTLIDLGKLRFYWAGAYSPTTEYELNDVVKYGGNVYVYTNVARTIGIDPNNQQYWALMVQGLNFRGEWNPATAYKIGDGIAYGGNVYIALQDGTNQNPATQSAYWGSFVDGIQYEGNYNAATAYQPNDVVTYGSNLYIATAPTTGNVPTNTSFWTTFITNIRSRGDWSATTEYFLNDVVIRGGNTYICVTQHTSSVFATDLAANKWTKFNSGVRWRGSWATGTAYIKDDIVRDAAGSAYIAAQDHTAGASFLPDRDAGKWTLFAVGSADVLPPIQANDLGQSLTVKPDGSIDWIGATASANVFYVAPHGVDAVGNGGNLAAPFASIKYACAQAPAGSTIFVKTGTYSEQLPILVPANVAIVGDNQRTTIVQPKSGLSDDGATPNSQSTMFLMSNGSILNKMTFVGMTGWVPGSTASDITTSAIKGVVVRMNPASPVTTKSPYVLECSAIGSGLIGALIDGAAHTSGNKTMIFHGFTVISDNGVGYWVKDGGKAEIVSCFTYYCYFGYTASGGGQIRALNGNNSYGTWGATSRGFDANEVAVTGALYGQQLNFLYGGGNINVGDTVTSSAGGTAIVTNVQTTANKVYVRNVTGTFVLGNTLTFTSGGTGTVSAGAVENQKGFVLVLNNLTARPVPGQSIQIAGDSVAYVVQSVSGSWTNASSVIAVVLAQEKPTGSADGAVVTLRSKYSQIRLTGHDFLSIGTGGVATTNYPGTPTQAPAQGNETDEAFPGRVFYVSTDQDGNFRVGEYFRIDQATGRATLNASAFDLAGLTSLRLGSIGAQLGETINEFSSDGTLSGNSNVAVPTEQAVKTYVDAKVPDHPDAAGLGFLADDAGGNSFWFSGAALLSGDYPRFDTGASSVTLSMWAGAQSINAFRASNAAGNTVTHTITAGSLPAGLTMGSNGTITGTWTSGSGTATFTVRAVSNNITVSKQFTWVYATKTPGQALFGTNVGTGTFSWTAPTGVDSVSVVCVGGGAGGGQSWSYAAGAGGGLGWKNNIPVVAGQSYTVRVGRAGNASNGDNYGGNSYFISLATVAGGGGSHQNFGTSETALPNMNGNGGGWVGDGGGAGGNCTNYQGGAGAGGYTGNGGNNRSLPASGSGGAVGGSYYSSSYGSGGGGGVGLNGRGQTGYRWYNPFSGWSSSDQGYGSGGEGGSGGSTGGYGENPFNSTGQYGPPGGTYGGGGGGPGTSWPGGQGGQGGVRIIWGQNRAFPDTNTADV